MTHPGSPRRGGIVVGVVLGAIVGIMIVGLVWSLTVANRPKAVVPAPTPAVTSQAPTAAAPASTPEAPVASESPTPPPPASPTPSAPEAPVEGVVTSLPPDSYLTVLESLGKSHVTAEQAKQKAAELSTGGFTVVVLDTDAFPTLTPGYWALVVTGAESGQDAKARCEPLGRTFGDKCYVRHIPG